MVSARALNEAWLRVTVAATVRDADGLHEASAAYQRLVSESGREAPGKDQISGTVPLLRRLLAVGCPQGRESGR